MKKQSKQLLLVIFCLAFLLPAQSQETRKSMKKSGEYTPYELLSSYYNGDDFNPFEKKNWYVGLAFSLKDKQRTNTQGLIQKTLDGQDLDYDILVKGGYFIADYSKVGIDFNYYQSKSIGLVYQEPDTIQANSLTRGFALTPNIRSAIPLTESERLSFFVEFGIILGRAQTVTRNTKNIDDVSKLTSTKYDIGMGVGAGVTFFAMENFAFEIQLDIVSYKASITNSEIDGAEQTRDVRQNVHLSLDLFTMDLGLAYYF